MDGDFRVTLDTLEHGGFHLWENFTASDHDASETNESVDVFFLKLAHDWYIWEVFDCNHKFIFFFLFFFSKVLVIMIDFIKEWLLI